MRIPKPARWALGLLLVFAVLKGGCELGKEIIEHWPGGHEANVPTSPSDHALLTGRVGRGSRAYPGKPREKAIAFLKDNFRGLRLKQSLDDLDVVNERTTDFSSHVELQQVFNKLPVENARLQVNFDKDGHVLMVENTYVQPVNVSDEIAVSRERLESIVRQEFSRTTPAYVSKVDEQEQKNAVFVEAKDIKLAAEIKVDEVYFARKDQLRRAHRTYVHADWPFGIKEIITDAGDGAVLQIRDFVYNAVDGHGQVFNPNPVSTLNNTGLTDSNNSSAAVPSGSPTAYVPVSLPELEAPAGGPFLLKGPYVVLEDIEGPKNILPPPTNTSAPEFMFTRDSANFEDVMVYYHIDRMQRYIQSLGFTDVMKRRIRADAHACNNDDESRYVSLPDRNGVLLFGDGDVDDAEDADVIAHEYGHAIQDDQTQGKYAIVTEETKAMAEGFGDYWAFSVYKPENDASKFEPRCLMEWDRSPCVRKIEFNKLKEDLAASGDPHIDGLIWSSTLFHIFSKLGKQIADTLILQSHFNVPTGPNFKEGAKAILTADEQRFKSHHVKCLCEVFKFHHLLEDADCPVAPPGSECPSSSPGS